MAHAPQIRWIPAYASLNLTQAHLVRQAFEREGIPTQMRNEMLSSLAGAIPMTDAMPEVRVPEDRLEDAFFVLRQIQAPAPQGELSITREAGALSPLDEGALFDLEELLCPACGEASPGGFGECWSCQTSFS